MKNIYLLKICKIKGAMTEVINNYAFESEEQMNKMVEDIKNSPNSDVGMNPGTLLFKDTVVLFETTDSIKANVPEKPKANIFNNLSKGKSLPWNYKRPFR